MLRDLNLDLCCLPSHHSIFTDRHFYRKHFSMLTKERNAFRVVLREVDMCNKRTKGITFMMCSGCHVKRDLSLFGWLRLK